MYAIYVNTENGILTLANQRIYRGYRCQDWFWIFTLPYYKGAKISRYIAEIEFVLPRSGKKITEKVILKDECYNGFLKYSVSSKSKITNEPGIVHAKIIFKDSEGKIARSTSEFTFKISTTGKWHNDISDNTNSGSSGGNNDNNCNCNSEEYINELLSKTKPPAFNSVKEAEDMLNSGDISNVYYGQSIIIKDNGKYLSYTVQKGKNGYTVEPVDIDGSSNGFEWEEDI